MNERDEGKRYRRRGEIGINARKREGKEEEEEVILKKGEERRECVAGEKVARQLKPKGEEKRRKRKEGERKGRKK